MPRKRTDQLPPSTRYLGTPDLEVRYGVVRKTIGRWQGEGIIPPPDLIVHNNNFWKETTLDEADRANTAAAGATTEFGRRRKLIAAQ